MHACGASMLSLQAGLLHAISAVDAETVDRLEQQVQPDSGWLASHDAAADPAGPWILGAGASTDVDISVDFEVVQQQQQPGQQDGAAAHSPGSGSQAGAFGLRSACSAGPGRGGGCRMRVWLHGRPMLASHSSRRGLALRARAFVGSTSSLSSSNTGKPSSPAIDGSRLSTSSSATGKTAGTDASTRLLGEDPLLTAAAAVAGQDTTQPQQQQLDEREESSPTQPAPPALAAKPPRPPGPPPGVQSSLLRLLQRVAPPAADAVWRLLPVPPTDGSQRVPPLLDLSGNPAAASAAAGSGLPAGPAVRLPDRGPCVVGSAWDKDCDLILEVPTVSRRHAVLEVLNDRWVRALAALALALPGSARQAGIPHGISAAWAMWEGWQAPGGTLLAVLASGCSLPGPCVAAMAPVPLGLAKPNMLLLLLPQGHRHQQAVCDRPRLHQRHLGQQVGGGPSFSQPLLFICYALPACRHARAAV